MGRQLEVSALPDSPVISACLAGLPEWDGVVFRLFVFVLSLFGGLLFSSLKGRAAQVGAKGELSQPRTGPFLPICG